MNLFINAISENGVLILFDNDRMILSKKNIKILGNESSKLIGNVHEFLLKNDCTYNLLENLVVVNGPGSFTGVRTIVLAINTINYISKKSITQMSFFDLFNNYPIIKNSSRRDLFVKYNKSDTINIIKNDDFSYSGDVYGDIGNNLLSKKLVTVFDIDYINIIKNIVFQDNKLIEPLYIKKPSIS